MSRASCTWAAAGWQLGCQDGEAASPLLAAACRSGHDHNNDCEGTLQGIRLAYG